MIVALAGGFGGSKLAQGLYRVLPPDRLTVIVNTADDFDLYGLRICPDLDTVMYTLASLANPTTGWGVRGDSFKAIGMLEQYGEPAWFRLGDKDLGTHLLRTKLLSQGLTLTEATRELCNRLGIMASILPMCNEPVATRVDTPEGHLAFQEYFVQRRTDVEAMGVEYQGIEQACLTPEVEAALRSASRIVICPSNPILSVAPILSVPGLRQLVRGAACPTVAVSPLVGGKAVRGPLDRLLASLGYPASQAAIARFYADFLDGLIIDNTDRNEANDVTALGVSVLVADTLMSGVTSRERVANRVLNFLPDRWNR